MIHVPFLTALGIDGCRMPINTIKIISHHPHHIPSHHTKRRHITPSRNDANTRPSHHHHHHTTSFHHHHTTTTTCPNTPATRNDTTTTTPPTCRPPNAMSRSKHPKQRHDETTTTTTITHDASKHDRFPKRHHHDANARPQRVERRASAPGHTKDGQESAGRGQTAGHTRYTRYLLNFINDYLTGNIPVPSPPCQNTKNQTGAFFVSRTTPHLPPPPTIRACMFFCFSPQKHEKHAQAGVFLIIGTLPLPSNINDAPFRRVFGVRRPPSPPTTPENECDGSFSGR